MSTQIQFTDGSGYERFMGKWSQLAGAAFLDWLAAPAGAHWVDVGCGNGAFTELIVARTSPASVTGLDPSEAQLAHARTRFAPGAVDLQQGNAMAMPLADDQFDVAVMPLVIFFVADPGKGVAEMARVVRSGGLVAAYAWDMDGLGFPYEPLLHEMRALELPVPNPPRPEASRIDVMQRLWHEAGLRDLETTQFTVERSFDGFDDYWSTVRLAPSVGATLREASPAVARVEAIMRERLTPDAGGRITMSGRANAIKGRA